jgi:hypothetical protein
MIVCSTWPRRTRAWSPAPWSDLDLAFAVADDVPLLDVLERGELLRALRAAIETLLRESEEARDLAARVEPQLRELTGGVGGGLRFRRECFVERRVPSSAVPSRGHRSVEEGMWSDCSNKTPLQRNQLNDAEVCHT